MTGAAGHELVVRGGTVVDGTGLLRRRADVAVDDGRISIVGRVPGKGTVEIDATGQIVAPGLIDIHTHYDPQLTFEPFATSSCFHGVTTVVTGNCGFSVAPLRRGDHEWLIQMFARVEGMDPVALGGIPFDRFESFAQYLDLLEGGLGVNAAFYVGHSAVRRFVLGDASQEREATVAEIEAMQSVVADAMGAGAVGISSSHAGTHLDLAGRPVPSRLASEAELIALVQTAAVHGATTTGYLPRSVVTGGLDAGDEALILRLAATGVPVVIQGLGARSKVDAPTEGWAEAVRFVATADGLNTPVYSMTMSKPYNRTFDLLTGTTLYEGVPEINALFRVPSSQRRVMLDDLAFRAAARRGIEAPNTDAGLGSVLLPPTWDRLFVEHSVSAAVQKYLGRSVSDIATERGVHPLDAMLDIAVEDLAAVWIWRTESPAWIEGMRIAQRDPHMLIGTSDGGAHLDRDDGAEASSYFFAKWVREWQAFTLEEGVRCLTAVPAALCGFADRGSLLPGYAADLMIFDAETIAPAGKEVIHDFPGGAARWSSKPAGVSWTIVNGVPIVHDGTLCGGDRRPGRVLRPGRRLGP